MARQGEIVDGKYEILREIGRGGMSVVYLAMDKRLNKQWAIKEFRKDKDDESRRIALEALLKEANLMKKLDHPTLPRIVDIIEEESTVYIVMDYIEGESLNKVLDAYGAQPQDAVIEWAKQLSEVLDYLHTREPSVIYRDMKPANIMLKPDGSIRLIDFGIAREYKEGQAGDTTSIGTRGYAAPEQFGGKGQTDARTDIYSLGVTLYHLVTGKNPAEPPYEIYPIRHWNPNLSSGLEYLIQKCTQINPEDRFQSCAEVSYVLDNLEKFETAYKKKQRKKIRLFVIALACSLLFALIGVGGLVMRGADHDRMLQSYKDEGTISGYIKAIQFDNTDPESYIGLIELLEQDIETIYSGEAPKDADTEKLHENGEIYQGELDKALSNGNLKALEEVDPAAYVDVNFSYGLKLWNCYIGSGENSEENKSGTLEAINASNPYFENTVIEVQEKNSSFNLSDKNVITAKNYYLLGYFKANERNLSSDDKGEFRTSETVYNIMAEWDEKNLVGKSGTSFVINDPYLAYWLLIRDTTEGLSESDLPAGVQMTTIYLNANTLLRNVGPLTKNGTRPADEVETLYKAAVESFEEIEDGFGNQNGNTVEKRRQNLKEDTLDALVQLRQTLTDCYENSKKGSRLELVEPDRGEVEQ